MELGGIEKMGGIENTKGQTMKVEVTEIHDMNGVPGIKTQGCLRAYATIKIGPLIISKVKLIKQPGQKAYVSPPQLEYYANGRISYVPVVKWPPEWQEQIFTAVHDAYSAQHGAEEAEGNSLLLGQKH